jgi:hypothetical protein
MVYKFSFCVAQLLLLSSLCPSCYEKKDPTKHSCLRFLVLKIANKLGIFFLTACVSKKRSEDRFYVFAAELIAPIHIKRGHGSQSLTFELPLLGLGKRLYISLVLSWRTWKLSPHASPGVLLKNNRKNQIMFGYRCRGAFKMNPKLTSWGSDSTPVF